ncbi:hypothetical protein [Neisseria dentiae]|uniref:hypothetical protein n=1 Tax=Neisseria dentiae TaxID=194197 RepID=UPI00211CA7BC|nr:hypothetical protein [Neisseria dentiae]MCQ9327717.1 hypothetical protein [Neisseria dentiae]
MRLIGGGSGALDGALDGIGGGAGNADVDAFAGVALAAVALVILWLPEKILGIFQTA